MILEKGEPGPLEEWETVVGDDFSLYYDAYSVDERVDSDSKVCWCAGLKLPVQLVFPFNTPNTLVHLPPLSATCIPYLMSDPLVPRQPPPCLVMAHLFPLFCLLCLVLASFLCLTGSH